MLKSDLKIVFMGTPGFAVATLQKLIESNYNVVAVVTAPDKPAGRGQKIQEPPVKFLAVQNHIPVLQPDNLKNSQFIDKLLAYSADLFIVVAFRMLPEIVWEMPRFGTFNLHASLLPQYRGAAPINWAIINGEKETGVTTFFINKDIDTGGIIFQEKILIEEKDNAGTLHDKLMETGANLVIETVDNILQGAYSVKNQDDFVNDKIILKPAPKLFKDNCLINWSKSGFEILNLIRGLSPYPAAWTILKNRETGKELQMKIFEAEYIQDENKLLPGSIINDNKTNVIIVAGKGLIKLHSVQLEGKRRMDIADFIKGFSFSNHILL